MSPRWVGESKSRSTGSSLAEFWARAQLPRVSSRDWSLLNHPRVWSGCTSVGPSHNLKRQDLVCEFQVVRPLSNCSTDYSGCGFQVISSLLSRRIIQTDLTFRNFWPAEPVRSSLRDSSGEISWTVRSVKVKRLLSIWFTSLDVVSEVRVARSWRGNTQSKRIEIWFLQNF